MLDAAMLFLRVKLILLSVGEKKTVTRIYGDEKYVWFCRYYSFELCHRKKVTHIKNSIKLPLTLSPKAHQLQGNLLCNKSN